MTPDRNIPLLRKTLEHIIAHPEQWDQQNWTTSSERLARMRGLEQPCGTAYCFAGWAATFAGYDLDYTGHCYRDGELVSHVEYIAAEELGLTHDEALELGPGETESRGLFAPNNTLDDLKDQVYHLTDGEVDMR